MTAFNKNKSPATFIAALIIVFSAMTFWLPRETFDPHIGVDYDIFCQVFCNLASYDGFDLYHNELILIIKKIRLTVKEPVFTILIHNLPLIIRPPPRSNPLKNAA